MRMIGIHEDWTASPAGRTPAQVKTRYPKSGGGRPFVNKQTTVQDLRPKALSALQLYLDAGTKVIYISFKTDPTQTNNGDWDVRYAELATYLVSLMSQYGVEIIVIPWHEPEDDFLTGAAFLTYYNRVWDKMKAVAPSLKIKPCYLSYQWSLNAAGTASVKGYTDDTTAWFNAAKMTDGVCVDVYGGRSFPLEQILTEHPGFARWIQYVPASLRINLTERGWETPSSVYTTNRSALRASTMRREFDWLLTSNAITNRIDDYMIWSSPGTENAPGLIMDSAAEAEIDRFLASASRIPSTPSIPVPDKSHAQYQFGYAAGLADGKLQGRKSAFTETRDFSAARI